MGIRDFFFFFFKQKTAYEIMPSLVGSEMCIRDSSIAAEFNRIHQWEKEYNNYLKTASGFASSLKACTHLYNDGVRIFLTLGKLGKAIKNNPQGIIASMSMNNLYIETATELVSVFTLLNDAVAKGGTENMLTGAERSKTLWALNDKLSAFSRKLHMLYLSIRYYTPVSYTHLRAHETRHDLVCRLLLEKKKKKYKKKNTKRNYKINKY